MVVEPYGGFWSNLPPPGVAMPLQKGACQGVLKMTLTLLTCFPHNIDLEKGLDQVPSVYKNVNVCWSMKILQLATL